MENKENQTQIISDSQLLNLKLDKILEMLNILYQKSISEEETKAPEEERVGTFSGGK